MSLPLPSPSEARILPFPGTSPEPAPPRFTAGDVIQAYIADLAQVRDQGEITADHFANVRRSLDHAPPKAPYVGFSDLVGAKAIQELKQSDLQEWLRKNPRWKSDETKRRNLAAVLACFHWAADVDESIDHCPYKKTRREKLRRVERRDATDDETKLILERALELLRRVVLFIDRTGARTCEARLLRWSQVFWEDGVAELKEHKTSRQQEEPEPRIVGLEPEVLAELERWQNGRDAERDEGYVFVNARGRPWTRRALCLAFRRLRDKLQLPTDLSLYCFRHRCGTQMSASGMSDREVGDVLGHRDPRTTRRYTHTNRRQHIRETATEGMRRRKACRPRPGVPGHRFSRAWRSERGRDRRYVTYVAPIVSSCTSASFPSWTSSVRIRSPALDSSPVEGVHGKETESPVAPGGREVGGRVEGQSHGGPQGSRPGPSASQARRRRVTRAEALAALKSIDAEVQADPDKMELVYACLEGRSHVLDLAWWVEDQP